ncbi:MULTISPECIES: HpcH/HpaI aldolase/citrate lyase family protein [Streptomyces]|uniref:HpcH/HpaI aldolase/citrate lyase family protein n=1 Tax=Streptomyces TaxID=1883 RepID=UPI000787247C|nr:MULTISPECIES: CoA ester lyase [unclassified Streptomyces]AVH94207.1 CoA ester lyase [Streptomyces sp. WAC00288]
MSRPLTAYRLQAGRSFLFVPGDRPDRFDKAVATGADVVILDLEDAVAAPDKDRAREHVAAWLGTGNSAVVRINAPGTPWCDDDLAVATRFGAPVMVPKSDDPAVLADVARRTAGESFLIPLVETAAGIERAVEVCATNGAVRVALGNVDLAGQLGIAHDDHVALTYARSRLVSASAAVGLCAPIDGVTTAVKDLAALTADVAYARRLGFTGKLCIHPGQVAVVAERFAPTESEREWARSVVAAGDSVTVVDGHMVDKPVLERARRILCADRPAPH